MKNLHTPLFLQKKIYAGLFTIIFATATVFAGPLAMAKTPDDMLIIAHRIDDITSLDPAESFEFAGSDVNRNVYKMLINFDR